MATRLEDVVPAPHAPHAPSPEDVLGPPPRAPHAPTLGRPGGLVSSLRRPAPRPPHAPRVVTSDPGQRERVREIVTRYVPNPAIRPRASDSADDPNAYNPPRGMGRPGYQSRKAAREAAADMANKHRANPEPADNRGDAAAEAMRQHAQAQAAAGGTDAQAAAEAEMFANDPTYQAHNPGQHTGQGA